MVSGATPELLRKSGAEGVSLEGKFGWAALERLRSSSWAAPEQLRSQVEQGGAQKVKCVEPTWAALEWLIAATFCAQPCSAWLRSCSRAAPELLWSCSRAAHPNLPSKLTPLAPLLWSSSGAAPPTINFTCKIKLLRSQKQSSSPKNPIQPQICIWFVLLWYGLVRQIRYKFEVNVKSHSKQLVLLKFTNLWAYSWVFPNQTIPNQAWLAENFMAECKLIF